MKVESKLDLEEGVIVPCARGYLGNHWLEEPVALSGETYLRVNEVDLDDPQSIFAFTTRYGPLGGADAYDAIPHETDPFFAALYEGQLDLEGEREKKRRALWREVTRADPSLPDREPIDEHGLLPGPLELALTFPRHIETLDEFRFAARCIRDLATAWRKWREGLDAADLAWVSPSNLDADSAEDFAARLLAVILANFLYRFTPQLEFQWSSTFPRRDALGLTVEPQRGPTDAPLYAICALELFNHIIADAEYHICANERCGRTFVHQDGRSEKGQRRSRGVLYCTPACARATAQREYRRRLRRARAGEERADHASAARKARPEASDRP